MINDEREIIDVSCSLFSCFPFISHHFNIFHSFPSSLQQSVHHDFDVGSLQQNHSLQELIFSGQVPGKPGYVEPEGMMNRNMTSWGFHMISPCHHRTCQRIWILILKPQIMKDNMGFHFDFEAAKLNSLRGSMFLQAPVSLGDVG